MWLKLHLKKSFEVRMDVHDVKDAAIFREMSEEEIATALEQLSASRKRYQKGASILQAGTTTDRMGLVLSGSVTIENNDIWGNKTILHYVGAGDIFAETYGLLAEVPLLVDVIANEDCQILFLRIGNLRTMASGESAWTNKLVINLLTISANKNLTLSRRSFHTSPKTIRGRVMSYLNSVAIQKGKREFDIPFDRQQMADYLNVERTALSKELAKMKADHLIDFRKNHFVLL